LFSWLQSGHLPMPHFGPYSTSKHALEGLSDCMAYELAPQGIDVVLVKPGPARTPIWESLGTAEQRLAQVITSPDMARLYEADYVAVSER
jgi:NAD(P)-dependent dehydrogenase (short-subunit alcohol dehydrogenase family)